MNTFSRRYECIACGFKGKANRVMADTGMIRCAICGESFKAAPLFRGNLEEEKRQKEKEMKYVVSGVTKEELREAGVDCSLACSERLNYYLIENMIMVGKTAFLQIKDGWIYDGAINIGSDLSKLKEQPTIKEEIVVQGEAFGQCCYATVEMIARHAELFRSVVEGYKGYFGRVPTAAEILWCASEKLGYDITKEGE